MTRDVAFDVNLVKAAVEHKVHRVDLGSISLRTADPERAGFLCVTQAVAYLESGLACVGRKHPRKAAKSLLDQSVDHGFAERARYRDTGRRVIWLKSPARIAELLGTMPRASTTIPARDCFSRQPAQWLNLGIIAKREGTLHPPRPTAGQTRREMTGVGAVKRRRAERRAGVRVEQNWRSVRSKSTRLLRARPLPWS